MSRNIINIILGVIAIVLLVLIVKTVKDPIDKQAKIDKTEAAVISKLGDIKKAQMTYKEMNDTFASNFEDLIQAIKFGEVQILKKLGGKSADTLETIEVDTMWVSAFRHTFEEGYAIDQLGLVPPANKEKFQMRSSVINKNGIDVPVFEVIDPNPINPKRTLTLGSLDDAIYTGNWK